MGRRSFFIDMKTVSAFYITLLLISAACGRSDNYAPTRETESAEARHGKTAAPVDLWAVDSIAYSRWGSPASPYRNERRYIRFLDSLLAVDTLPDALRMQAEYRRRIALLNRPGTTAGDFRYIERTGKESRLHELKSPLTLLIFYDPECPHCNDILRAIASSETLNKAVAEKKLTVIAIYAEGKREVWNKTCNDLPENWLVGYDLTKVLDKEIYDLPAMPTPYLLDSEKRVILKDPNFERLIAVIAGFQGKINTTSEK